jgi:hypothetical protein
MRVLAAEHGEHWGITVTDELIRRDERELQWLAELEDLALPAESQPADSFPAGPP